MGPAKHEEVAICLQSKEISGFRMFQNCESFGTKRSNSYIKSGAKYLLTLTSLYQMDYYEVSFRMEKGGADYAKENRYQ